MTFMQLGQAWLNLTWYQVMLCGMLFFAAIYCLFVGLTLFLTRYVLPFFRYGGWLNTTPIASGQVRRELTLSALSILILGIGTIVPWGRLKWHWAGLATQADAWRVFGGLLALMLWNEVHFYLNHRALHLGWLKRYHLAHHRSVVTTPWSTYAFHPVEAMMLGSVLLLPMLVHDFTFAALLFTPILSLTFNSIGHSNYDFLPSAERDRWWLNGARRHHQHHVQYKGNYGFMFPFMDRLMGTALPIDTGKIH